MRFKKTIIHTSRSFNVAEWKAVAHYRFFTKGTIRFTDSGEDAGRKQKKNQHVLANSYVQICTRVFGAVITNQEIKLRLCSCPWFIPKQYSQDTLAHSTYKDFCLFPLRLLGLAPSFVPQLPASFYSCLYSNFSTVDSL